MNIVNVQFENSFLEDLQELSSLKCKNNLRNVISIFNISATFTISTICDIAPRSSQFKLLHFCLMR